MDFKLCKNLSSETTETYDFVIKPGKYGKYIFYLEIEIEN